MIIRVLILLNENILELLACCQCWCEAVYLVPVPKIDHYTALFDRWGRL
jgi:hypothetical protein